jgi:hypothetical protein
MSDALDRGLDEDDIAVLFGCSVQTVRATLSSSMLPRPSGKRWRLAQLPLPRRQLASLKPKSSGRRSLKSKRQLLAQPAMKKPGVSVRSSVKQSRVSNHARKLQKPSKMPAANMPRLCAGCLGRRYEY